MLTHKQTTLNITRDDANIKKHTVFYIHSLFDLMGQIIQ